MSAESVVLVEGYDDRDFWKGLLLKRGCSEARKDPPARHRQQSGFTYTTPSRALLHIVPCNGSDLEKIVQIKLKERAHKPLQRLVLSPDADGYATLDAAKAGVRSLITRACNGATETEQGDFLVDDGALVVSSIFVHADDARDNEGRLLPGVPSQRALEQLTCAALSAVYPERGRAVAQWLGARPAARGKEHKAHAWSFYAGWSTDHGTGDFYRSLWGDERIASELERLLRRQDSWRVIEALLTSS